MSPSDWQPNMKVIILHYNGGKGGWINEDITYVDWHGALDVRHKEPGLMIVVSEGDGIPPDDAVSDIRYLWRIYQ